MNRDDDTWFDETLREFLRRRAADTTAVREASAMSAAIALRLSGQGRRRDGALAGRLLLVATLTVLVLLAAATLFVGSQRPPVPPSSVGNGVIAYAIQSGLSPGSVYVVRSGEVQRQIIPSESSVGNSVVCPTFSPDGTMLAVGMRPAGASLSCRSTRRARSAMVVAFLLAPARHTIALHGRRTARQSPSLIGPGP